MQLLQLPTEILARVFQDTYQQTLGLDGVKNLRLCCKRLASTGSDTLFEVAVLRPDEENDDGFRLSTEDEEEGSASSISAEAEDDGVFWDEMEEEEVATSSAIRRDEKISAGEVVVDSDNDDWISTSSEDTDDDGHNLAFAVQPMTADRAEGLFSLPPDLTYKPSDIGTEIIDEEGRAIGERQPEPEKCGYSTTKEPRAKLYTATSGSISKFTLLQNHPEIRHKIRKVIIYTTLDVESDTSERLGEAWMRSVLGLCRFSNLSSVCVNFHPDCSAESKIFWEAAQGMGTRHRVLEALFAALNNQKHPLLQFRNLELNNLQDANSKKITNSVGFKKTMRSLKNLRITVATDNDRHHPWVDVECTELYTFFQIELPSFWLRQACQNLTELSLGADRFWGWMPYFDFRDLNFPNLQHMSLYNYTVACDEQIDWLCVGGPHLKTLMLRDCPIVVYSAPVVGTITEHAGELCRYGQEKILVERCVETDEEFVHWIYNTRWHDIYSRIERELSHLERFEFRGLRYTAFEGLAWSDDDEYEEPIIHWKRSLTVFDPSKVEPFFLYCPEEDKRMEEGEFIHQPSTAALESTRELDDESSRGCGRQDEEALNHLLEAVRKRRDKVGGTEV